jgi:hypothetical protein
MCIAHDRNPSLGKYFQGVLQGRSSLQEKTVWHQMVTRAAISFSMDLTCDSDKVVIIIQCKIRWPTTCMSLADMFNPLTFQAKQDENTQQIRIAVHLQTRHQAHPPS